MIFKKKAFWILFGSFSLLHVSEDMVWAFLARYTTISFWILIIGILAWSFLTAVLINIPPLNKLKTSKN